MQLQLYPFTSSLHVAPFRQGALLHSSISINNKFYLFIYLFILFFIFGDHGELTMAHLFNTHETNIMDIPFTYVVRPSSRR